VPMGILDEALGALGEGRGRDLRFRQSMEIAAAYGAALENASPASGTVGDAGDLPFSKDAIKHALVMLLKATGDPVLREPLKIGYIRLADWQDHDESAHVPLPFGHPGTRGNPLALAQQLAAGKDLAARLAAAAKTEQRSLIEELRRLNL
jgi:hypothetical protein